MGVWLFLGVLAGPVLAWALRGWMPAVARPGSVVAVMVASTAVSALVEVAFSDPVGAWWWMTVCGLGLAGIDVACHRLPHLWVGALALGGLVAVTADAVATGEGHAVLRALAAGATALAVGVVLTVLIPQGMGFGDYTLLSALAMYAGWLSWSAVVVTLSAALLGLGLMAGGAWVLGVRTGEERMAAGPGLLLGAWLALGWLT